MTTKEFNEKWAQYLEPKFYGLDIGLPEVITYLDKEFEEEVKENPNFTYSQIKIKFGFSRVYAETSKALEWEKHINSILREYYATSR
jgi:hypothetical protein